MTFQWIELILSIFGGLGMLALGLGYAYSQFKEGSTKNKLDTITLLKEDVQTLREEVGELTKKVEELTKEIGEKDKKLSDTLAILQGRDPEMQNFIVGMMQYMADNKPFIEDIKIKVLPVVAKMDKFLDGQVLK